MDSEEVERRTSSRTRKSNIALHMKGVQSEKCCGLKKTRRGHLKNITANVNGTTELPSDGRNLQEVDERPAAAKDAFLQFKGAHMNYTPKVDNEEGKVKALLH